MKKIVIKVVLALVFTVLVLAIMFGIWWFLPAHTPRIKSGSGRSLAELEFIKIGGTRQCVLIRSEDTSNPILLFLHGGPGMPVMFLAHKFQKPLEKYFTVVQWDRRGAGKTYAKNVPSVESMNVRQLVNDAFDLIDTLRARYHQDKVILVGHSFGTYLGSIMVSERPELFRAFISVGQVTDGQRARKLQEEFIKAKADSLGRSDIISQLNANPDINFENWLFGFGGELKDSKSFLPLLWAGLTSPEYTLRDALKVAKGSSFSSANMKYNVLTGSVYEKIRSYSIPVCFFVGRYDYTTPWPLIARYYDLVTAPRKEIIYFENSAHFPFFEEPEKFCDELIRFAQNLN